MLKRGVIIFCLVSGLTALLSGEAVLRGIIVRQNSGGQPIAGAQVSAFGANTIWSHESGQFELIFIDKNPGDTVVLTVKKEKLEVVNDRELTVTLRTDPDRVIKIVMCGVGQRDKYAREYYRISEKSINRNFEKLLKQIQDKEIDIQEKARKIAELEKQRDAALAQAKELAEQFSRVNLDEASELYRSAFQYFRQGEIDKALKVLDDVKMEAALQKARQEKQRAEKRLSEADQAIKQCADNYILKAQLCITQFKFDLAEQYFQKAISADPNNPENIFKFAVFLQNQNQHVRARDLYQRVLTIARNDDEEATTLNNLGLLYSDISQHKEAQEAYKRALKIREDLAVKNPYVLRPEVAIILNNLGVLYYKTNHYKEAHVAYNRALKIREALAGENPAAYLPDVAMTLNNLGLLYDDTNRYKEAQAAYNGALKIFEALARKNPATYRPHVAVTLNNLGNLYVDLSQHKEAQEAYSRALKIREDLAVKNPAAYLPDVGITLNNLGLLDLLMDRKTEGISLMQRALEIREKLTGINPERFELDLCETLIPLSLMYGEMAEAGSEQSYRQRCLSMINRAITILERYPEIPKAQKYLEIARQLKQNFEQPQDN